MTRLAAVVVGLVGCTSGPLEERLAEPDVAIPAACADPGTVDFAVSGTAVDLDGKPVAGVSIDLTTAWGTSGFPAGGCHLGRAVTDANGRYGPVMVTTRTTSPVIVALATGAGLAPTLADRTGGCLLGCSPVTLDVVTVPADVAVAWREELYAGGMEYALNRGLVAYQFREADRATPASGVEPAWTDDVNVDDELYALAPDRDVRFLALDRRTLAAPGTVATLGSGYALIGKQGDKRGYFAVAGNRGSARWHDVGVIVATGWIYFETGDRGE